MYMSVPAAKIGENCSSCEGSRSADPELRARLRSRPGYPCVCGVGAVGMSYQILRCSVVVTAVVVELLNVRYYFKRSSPLLYYVDESFPLGIYKLRNYMAKGCTSI